MNINAGETSLESSASRPENLSPLDMSVFLNIYARARPPFFILNKFAAAFKCVSRVGGWTPDHNTSLSLVYEGVRAAAAPEGLLVRTCGLRQ